MELGQVVLFLLLVLVDIGAGQVPPPPLLAYGDMCYADIECDPWTDVEERRVICDKSYMQDGTGYCLCPGQDRAGLDPHYKDLVTVTYVFSDIITVDPILLVRLEVGCNKLINEGTSCLGDQRCRVEGYICRTYDPAFPNLRKCLVPRKSVWTMGVCDPRSPANPCYLPTAVDKAGNLLNFECRQFLWFEFVNPDGSVTSGLADDLTCWPKDRQPNADNTNTYLNFDMDVKVHCLDDSDCEDPHAVCRVPFTGVVLKYCICDTDSGYFFTYDVERDKEVCKRKSGYNEECSDVGDCVKGNSAAITTNLLCTPDAYGPFKSCQCSSPAMEYFAPTRTHPQTCEMIVNVGAACSPDFRLSLENKRIHNCKKLSGGQPTGLGCPSLSPPHVCTCRRETAWDAASGRCLPQYANLDENCESGSSRGLRCHPLGNLDCEPNSKTCICDHSSDLDERGFRFCSPHDKVGRYGDYCGLGFICNQELNLICTLHKCICIVDESVEDTGSACAEKRKKRSQKVKSGGPSLTVGLWTAILFCFMASFSMFQ